MSYYYLAETNEVVGPISEKALKELIAVGVLTDASQVCREGTEEWISYLEAIGPGAAPEEVSQPARKPIEFYCVHCGQNFSVEPSAVGLATSCPSCGDDTAVPSPNASTEPTDSPLPEVRESAPDETSLVSADEPPIALESLASGPSAKRPLLPKLAVWAAISLMLILAAIVASNVLSGRNENRSTELVKQADAHALGIGGNQDWLQAAALLEEAADFGNHEAEFKLGTCYLFGRGVPQDTEKGVNLFRRSAEGGFAEAKFNLSVCYAKGNGVEQNEEEMLKWLKLAADQKFPQAQHNLGLFYLSGQAVPQDQVKGIDLITDAAHQGLAQAQYELSLCFEMGNGVPKDMVQACKWAIIATRSGLSGGEEAVSELKKQLSSAQIAKAERQASDLDFSQEPGLPEKPGGVGVSHETSELTNETLEELFQTGLRYFQGEKFSGEAALESDVEVQDYNLAFENFLAAASQGHPEAQYYLAISFVTGSGAEEDLEKAIEWLRRAADQGLGKAEFTLGVSFINGEGVEKDEKTGLGWIVRAASQGEADAQWFLGLRYLRGEGVELNEERGAQLLIDAADQGHAQASYDLALCFEEGIGVENDPAKASQYLGSSRMATLHLARDGGTALGADHPLAESDPEQQVDSGLSYMQGSGGFVESEKNAVYLFRKAAERGNRRGEYCLGYAYSIGSGVEIDYEQAVKWLRKSADQNWPAAQFQLGECYFWGHGVEKDEDAALSLFLKAAPHLPESNQTLCANRIKVLRDKHGKQDAQPTPSPEMKPSSPADSENRPQPLGNSPKSALAALSLFETGTLVEAKECIKLLDARLEADPGNQGIILIKTTIMDVFRAESALIAALKRSPEQDKRYNKMRDDLRVASQISPLTGRVIDERKVKQLHRAAEVIRANEEAKVRTARSNLQKSINSARKAIPSPEKETLSHVWDKIAKRHQL